MLSKMIFNISMLLLVKLDKELFYLFSISAVGLVNLFFFFQAEGGIRDLAVTGVQTCALPISRNHSGPAPGSCSRRPRRPTTCRWTGATWSSSSGPTRGPTTTRSPTSPGRPGCGPAGTGRSEERRVGKGCGTRGLPDMEESNNI